MVEPVRHLRPPAADDIRHRAARNQFHHDLDAFRTHLPDIFDVRHLCGPWCRQLVVEKNVVPPLIDQPASGPWRLKAVA
jgi:hypothetical protein